MENDIYILKLLSIFETSVIIEASSDKLYIKDVSLSEKLSCPLLRMKKNEVTPIREKDVLQIGGIAMYRVAQVSASHIKLEFKCFHKEEFDVE